MVLLNRKAESLKAKIITPEITSPEIVMAKIVRATPGRLSEMAVLNSSNNSHAISSNNRGRRSSSKAGNHVPLSPKMITSRPQCAPARSARR